MEKYPSWRYHATEQPRVVNNELEDLALGEGWADSPAKLNEKPAPKKQGKG